MCATFSDSEKRKKLNKLIECIADIEGDLIQATSKTANTKESIRRFFNNKTFGTFE